MATDEIAVPPEFREALVSLRGHRHRPEVRLEEVPAPTRIAPYAAALTAEINPSREPEDLLGSGRFVVLHDPDEPTAWRGSFRLVVMARATLEAELGADPFLGEVTWSWLLDALEAAGAGYHTISGTVTRVLSQSFGGLVDSEEQVEVELRASWTPRTTDLAPHLLAWVQLCATAAGLAPVPAGVTALGPRG